MRWRRSRLHRLAVGIRSDERRVDWFRVSGVDRHDRRIIRFGVESGIGDANPDGYPHSDRDTCAYGHADSDAHSRSD